MKNVKFRFIGGKADGTMCEVLLENAVFASTNLFEECIWRKLVVA
jgi:hypothetical protein